MPTMVRWNPKANKIAYAILGKPENMIKEKKTKKKERLEEWLVVQETQRVR